MGKYAIILVVLSVLAKWGWTLIRVDVDGINVPRDGSGCWPLDENSSWIAQGSRRFNVDALPAGARAFICYDGRATAELTGDVTEPRALDAAVVLVENFLTEEEIRHFKAGIEREAQPTAQSGYSFRFVAGEQYVDSSEDILAANAARLLKDNLLNQLEDRIAAVTGVAKSADETFLQYALDGEQPQYSPPNIHHDKNHGLVRHSTSLIYLTTPEEGGETIFPALPFVSGGPSARTTEFKRYFEEFRRIVDKQINHNSALTPYGDWPAVQVEKDSMFHKELSAMCPAEAKGQDKANQKRNGANNARPLSVRPVPGRAIFFWQEVVGGSEPLIDVFHGGCPVVKGKKMSLQKFKNFAKGSTGCDASKWCTKFF